MVSKRGHVVPSFVVVALLFAPVNRLFAAIALCPPSFQSSLGFAAMLCDPVGAGSLCVAFACPASVEFWNLLLSWCTNEIKGKDTSETKLRCFVTWFRSLPLPQTVNRGLQSRVPAVANVYFFYQIVSAAATACGAQFVSFGTQVQCMGSTTVR